MQDAAFDARKQRLISGGIFLAVTLLGVALAIMIYQSQAAAYRNAVLANAEAIGRALDVRIEQNVALLRAARAVLGDHPELAAHGRFKDFIARIDLDKTYPGVRGIGYAPLIARGDEARVTALYHLSAPIHPDTDQRRRAPIVVLEPRDARNLVAIGYDMFSEDIRRSAIELALAGDAPSVSAPVRLVQEITEGQQRGFLVYLAARDAQGEAMGLVYAPFRFGEFVDGAVSADMRERYDFRISDVTEANENVLYVSPDFTPQPASQLARRQLAMGGRVWRLEVAYDRVWKGGAALPISIAVGATSLLLGFAMAMSHLSQTRARETAQKLADQKEKMLAERDLLMQEMKHRIKNSIARIAAIANTTARSTTSLPEFIDMFSGRLNAMAKAQDLLTRSRWESAPLRTILENEIAQVFPIVSGRVEIAGPDVELNGRQAQGFGLAFHELATNAAKYGAARRQNGQLTVDWSLEPDGALSVRWRETWPEGDAASASIAPNPPAGGFGAKLLDAVVRGELDGTLSREVEANGFSARIRLPRFARKPTRLPRLLQGR